MFKIFNFFWKICEISRLFWKFSTKNIIATLKSRTSTTESHKILHLEALTLQISCSFIQLFSGSQLKSFFHQYFGCICTMKPSPVKLHTSVQLRKHFLPCAYQPIGPYSLVTKIFADTFHILENKIYEISWVTHIHLGRNYFPVQ